MTRKKGVLFDMDGTLINTYENVNFKQALSELKTVQKTLILKILKSRVKSFAELEARIHEEVEDPQEAKELVQRVSDFLLNHYAHASLKKDAVSFLHYLRVHEYKICLCTNNATSIVQQILKDKQLLPYFDCVITSQQVSKSKPHPQMYLQALENIQLPAKDCIVFEDTENGVLAATHAGMEVIAVCEKDKRKFADCALVIKDYSDQRLYEMF